MRACRRLLLCSLAAAFITRIGPFAAATMLINAENRKNNAVRRFLLNDYTDWRELFIETIPSARSRFDWTSRGARALGTRCNVIYCARGTTQTSSDRITLTRFYCGHCLGAMQATPKHQLKASRARDNFLFPQRNRENRTPMFDVWLLIRLNVFIVKIGRALTPPGPGQTERSFLLSPIRLHAPGIRCSIAADE